jgi:hypothetical protein
MGRWDREISFHQLGNVFGQAENRSSLVRKYDTLSIDALGVNKVSDNPDFLARTTLNPSGHIELETSLRY